jgi:mitogen-activated protein kinase 1/3
MEDDKKDKKSKRIELGFGRGKEKFATWECGPDYKLEKILGRGSYGEVARAEKISTGKKVAIKKMDDIFDDEIDCKRILREVTLLRLLRHPCVVELVEILMPKDPETFTTIYVVMEFAESDVKKLMRGNFHL